MENKSITLNSGDLSNDKDENDRLNIIRIKQKKQLKKDEEIKLHTDHITGALFIYDNYNDIYYYKNSSGLGWCDNEEPYRTFLNKLKLKIKEQKNKDENDI